MPRAWAPWLPWEPLALEYLAAVAADGHQVRIFDCVGEFPQQYRALPNDRFRLGASPEQIKGVIASWRPDIVGITIPFSTQMRPACSIADLAKEVDSDIVTVIGGIYACAEPERLLLENPSLDIVAVGEGELTFKELLDRGATGLDQIKGIFYRKGESIVRNEPRGLIDNIDEIPFPRRDLVPFQNYASLTYTGTLQSRLKMLLIRLKFHGDWKQLRARMRHKTTSLKPASPIERSPVRRACIITSRGCPFNCTFCLPRKVYGGQYRMRSSQNVLDEMEVLAKEYGAGGLVNINISDENFNISKQRLIEICKGVIERELNLIFASQMYLMPWLDFETFSLMKKAGFNRVYFGIENASQEIVEKVLNKKINLDIAEEVIESCKKAGIIPGAYLMTGVPGETIETMENTIEFALNSGLELVNLLSFQPVPGTKLYDDCVKNGWLVDGYDPSEAFDPANSRSYVKTPDFSPEDVYNITERGKKLLREAGKLDQPIVR